LLIESNFATLCILSRFVRAWPDNVEENIKRLIALSLPDWTLLIGAEFDPDSFKF
jgi:hypothetical protein